MLRLALAAALLLPSGEAAAAIAARVAAPSAASAASGPASVAAWSSYLGSMSQGLSVLPRIGDDGRRGALASLMASAGVQVPEGSDHGAQAQYIASALTVEIQLLRLQYASEPESFLPGRVDSSGRLQRLLWLKRLESALPPDGQAGLALVYEKWAAAHGAALVESATKKAEALARLAIQPELAFDAPPVQAPAGSGRAASESRLAPSEPAPPEPAAAAAPPSPGSAPSRPGLSAIIARLRAAIERAAPREPSLEDEDPERRLAALKAAQDDAEGKSFDRDALDALADDPDARVRLEARLNRWFRRRSAPADDELLTLAFRQISLEPAGSPRRQALIGVLAGEQKPLPAEVLDGLPALLLAVPDWSGGERRLLRAALHPGIGDRELMRLFQRIRADEIDGYVKSLPGDMIARLLLLPLNLKSLELLIYRFQRGQLPEQSQAAALQGIESRWARSTRAARLRLYPAFRGYVQLTPGLVSLLADALGGADVQEALLAADVLLYRRSRLGDSDREGAKLAGRIARASRHADPLVAAKAIQLGAFYKRPVSSQDVFFLLKAAAADASGALDETVVAVLGRMSALDEFAIEFLRLSIDHPDERRAAALTRMLGAAASLNPSARRVLLGLVGDRRLLVSRMATQGLAKQQGPWPEEIVAGLLPLLEGPRAAQAAELLKRQPRFPPALFRYYSRIMKRGSDAAAAQAGRELAALGEPSPEQRHAVLDGWRKAAPSRKPAYAQIVGRWFTAGQIARELWPEHASALTQLFPDLETMGAHGFDSKLLETREAREQLLSSLRRTISALGDLKALGKIASLSALQPVAIMDRGAIEHRSKDYGFDYPVPGLISSRETRPVQVAKYSLGSEQGRRQADALLVHFDRLIEANFASLRLLSEFVDEPTRRRAEGLVAVVGQMVEAYEKLDPSGADAHVRAWEATKAAAVKSWEGLGPQQKLSQAAVGAIITLDAVEGRVSVHGTVNRLHQAGLEAMLKQATRVGADGTFIVGRGQVSLLDAGKRAAIELGRARSPFLRLLPLNNIARGTLVLRDDEAWYHLQLGVHKAELHVKLAGPDEGGLVSLRYSDSYDNHAGSSLRKAHVSAMAQMLGLRIVDDKGKFLSAVLDKDRGLASLEQLERVVPTLIAGLNRTRNLDLELTSGQTHQSYLSDMRESLLADGQVDFFEKGLDESMKIAARKREERRDGKLRAAVDAELARLGLPALPADGLIGQRLIDEHYNVPLRRLRAGGQIAPDAEGLPQRTALDPLTELARAAREDEEGAVRRATWLGAAPEELRRYESLGSIGRLKAERAYWPDPAGEDVVVDVLREPGSGGIAYASARARTREGSRTLTSAEFEALMRERGVAAPDWSPGLTRRRRWKRLLEAQPSAPSERPVVLGLPASAGRGAFASGAVAFRGKGDERAGGVFMTPYTTPDDLDRMRRASAVVTTGGGLLSHAAITTRELGIPAVIVPNAGWASSGSQATYRFELEKPAKLAPNGLYVRPAAQVLPVTVVEGTVLRVDGREGRVELLGANEAERALYAAALDYLRGAGAKPEQAALSLLGGEALPAERVAAFLIEEAFWGAHADEAKARALSALRAWDWKKARAAALALLERRHSELRLDPDWDSRDGGGGLEGARALEVSRVFELDGYLHAVYAAPGAAPAAKRLPEKDGPALRALAAQPRLAAPELSKARALLRRTPERAEDQSVSALRARVDAAVRERSARVRETGPLVLPFDRIDDSLTWVVGGKTAKLGEIAAVVKSQGARLPDGFGVTTYAYRAFLRESGLEPRVDALAAEIDAFLAKADLDAPGTLKELERYSERMRELIRSVPIPATGEVGSRILTQLDAQKLGQELLAVRSSAVQEDRDEAAFAGAAESYLYVSREQLLERVADSWASFWLARGMLYRRRQGILSTELEPAVTVQLMAPAESAGVMFTVNPVNGKRQIVVNAAYGLGEGVVSGLVQADQYVLDRRGEEVEAAVLGDKAVQVVRAAGGIGTEIKPVPGALRRARALKPAVLKRLARVGAALHEHFGIPMDIEFAIVKNKVYVLQSRPVTVSGGR